MKSKSTKTELMSIIKEVLREVSATGTGAGVTPGKGEQYATPKAFDKKKVHKKK